MGMFDDVILPAPIPCPVCKRELIAFQSKDRDCRLDKLAPHDVFTFYTFCECGQWVQFERNAPNREQDWRELFVMTSPVEGAALGEQRDNSKENT